MPSTKARVKVLASPEQQARWSEAARTSGLSLSAWLAGLADAECKLEKVEIQAPVRTPVPAQRPAVEAVEPRSAPCGESHPKLPRHSCRFPAGHEGPHSWDARSRLS
jgi:hypothetical protein